MASILKRQKADGSTTYTAQVRLKGHPTAMATFDKERDAKRWAVQTEAAIREGRYFKTVEARRHTLSELIERYIEEILPQKPRSSADVLRQLTWWKEQLGSLALDDISPARLAEAKLKLSKGTTPRGTRRAPGTVNRYIAALSHVFTIATKEWQWVQDNPMRVVTKLKEPRGRVRFLSDDERTRLLNACRNCASPVLLPIVTVAIYTGMRREEILELTWTNVDFERTRALIYKTKNDKPRAVPLAPPVMDALKECQRTRRSDTDLIFPSPEIPDQGIEIGKTFPKAVARAGITDCHFHDLRHTAASYLAMSGASLQEIAEILGHKTLSMVKRYAHLTEQHTAGVVARMAEKFAP